VCRASRSTVTRLSPAADRPAPRGNRAVPPSIETCAMGRTLVRVREPVDGWRRTVWPLRNGEAPPSAGEAELDPPPPVLARKAGSSSEKISFKFLALAFGGSFDRLGALPLS